MLRRANKKTARKRQKHRGHDRENKLINTLGLYQQYGIKNPNGTCLAPSALGLATLGPNDIWWLLSSTKDTVVVVVVTKVVLE